MLKCQNRGCEKVFEESENNDEACRFHSGAPIFHEGLKGWSCCTKRVIDFDEFLAIPGCQVGAHSTKKQQVEAKENKENVKVDVPKIEKNESGKVVEVYGKKNEAEGDLKFEVKSEVKSEERSEVKSEKSEVKEEDLNDPIDADIKVDSVCKRLGCNHKKGSDGDNECFYHPGSPIFHEGSKGYSCCSRKVLEFEEFLKIKGCKSTPRHRYLDPIVTKALRTDWYQTQSTVTISVFCKQIDKENSKIEIEKDSVNVHIKFLDGSYGAFQSRLFNSIDASNSKFVIYPMKVELVLTKLNGISWPSIEPTTRVKSFTTFGTVGGVGTVGGKEMVLSNDVPIEILK